MKVKATRQAVKNADTVVFTDCSSKLHRREERRPLLPRPSQHRSREQARDKSPQRHQRDRHPRLVFPHAPSHDQSSSILGAKLGDTAIAFEDVAVPSTDALNSTYLMIVINHVQKSVR